MDDGDVAVLDLEHHNLPHPDGRVLVGQKENVAALKRRLHRTTAQGKGKGEAGQGQSSVRLKFAERTVPPHHRAHLSTTTTGDSDFVTNINPFHIISAEKTIMAKLSAWNVSCRLFFHSFFSSIT